MSGRDVKTEVVGGIISLAYALVMTFTIVASILFDGVLVVIPWWHRDLELFLGFFSIVLLTDRLKRDLDQWKAVRLYSCKWGPCGNNMDGWCTLKNEDKIRQCKKDSRDGWGRDL